VLEERIRAAVESLHRVQPEPPPIERLRARRRHRRLAGLAAVTGAVVLAVTVPLSVISSDRAGRVDVVTPARGATTTPSAPAKGASSTGRVVERTKAGGHERATTTIYMAPSSSAPPDIAIADDVALLSTDQVATAAVTNSRLPITPTALRASVKGKALSDSIVQITVSAPTKAEAIAEANAVARAFVMVHVKVQGDSLQLQIAEYQGDLSQLSQQISNLTAQIAALTPAAPAQPSGQVAAQIQNLTNLRASDIQQQNTLTTELNSDQVNLNTLRSGNIIVDPAQ
jgi:hypothetical protein